MAYTRRALFQIETPANIVSRPGWEPSRFDPAVDPPATDPPQGVTNTEDWLLERADRSVDPA